MRAEALKEVGVLDEAFFMYGEDIDLSWRIVKEVGKSITFLKPKSSITREKAQEGSLNYVTVFYKAMLIFAAKHFEGGQAWIYNMLIRLAIYARATLSIIRRVVERIFLPIVAEGLVLFGALNLILDYYSNYTGIEYNWDFAIYSLGAYSGVFVLFLWLFGGYDKPWIP